MTKEKSYNVMRILDIEEAKRHAKGKNVVIVTGTSGQDGSFMVDYLLKNPHPLADFVIFGGARRLSVSNHDNIKHLDGHPHFRLINFDLTDAHSISQTISQLQPSYFINFAAQSFVKSSWDFPAQTWETNTTSMIHILEAIRLHSPGCRFYNAGSSEEFGDVIFSPQNERHPMRPRSPYGASKVAARQLVMVYRKFYGLYAIQGWLFNHEGTRRGEEFVTRKITKGVSKIWADLKRGVEPQPLELGNLDARRDWSDAEDCVHAVWRMLNQEQYIINYQPVIYNRGGGYAKDIHKYIKEYVVSSGESHTVREFVEEAFKNTGIKGHWEGMGIDEKYIYKGIPLVQINPAYYRPAEIDKLLGDSSKIREELGWTPKTSFQDLVKKMVFSDLGQQ